MTQSPHHRIAELHNIAAHAHSAAAVAHEKGDHLSAHELSRKAFEQSREAHVHAEHLAHDTGMFANNGPTEEPAPGTDGVPPFVL